MKTGVPDRVYLFSRNDLALSNTDKNLSFTSLFRLLPYFRYLRQVLFDVQAGNSNLAKSLSEKK